MVKKTQRKYLLKAIKKTGISFFAVALIAATSIAIYLGIQSGAVTILQYADQYFKDNSLATMEITCANGITQEDIDMLIKQPEVDAAEGGYRTMVLMDSEREKIILQVRSLLKELNQADVIEGELPEADDEVAIEQKFAIKQGLALGDELHIEHDGELVNDKFRVTAIINEPSFSCADVQDSRGKADVGLGSASYYIEVAEEAFDASYYDNCYTTAYVGNNALSDIYFYSEEYTEQESALILRLEELGKQQAKLRYDSLKQEADEKIGDAEQKLTDAETELQEGEEQLAEGWKELEESQKLLDNMLAEIETVLNGMALSKELNTAKTQLDAMGASGVTLSAAITEYQENADRIAETKEKLAEKTKELADAEYDIEEAGIELADARKEAEDIQLKDWIVSGRNTMGDVSGIETIVEGLFTLSYSFALVFLLVAVVVCYAAVVKMIDDQRMLIGAQKALGFKTKEIFLHYLSYNMLCAVLGIIIGCIAGVVIVENLVLYVFGYEFLYEKIPLSFVWKEAGIVALLCFAIFMAATCAGCIRVVRQPAVSLLRGELPTQKKAYFFESWNAYKRMNLYSRTMIKNVLSDKGRILTTIMGVVGCMSLLIITFTLKFSISNATDVQFEKYFLYENRLVINTEAGQSAEYEELLEQEGITFRRIQDKLQNFRVGGDDWETIHVIAADNPEQFDGFIYLEDVETKKQAELPEEGVLISQKCAENYGLESGSLIELMDAEGNARECKIAGVIEHYLPYHQIVTSAKYYEEVFGEKTDACVFLLKGNIDGLYEKVRDKEGFMSLKDNSEYKDTFESINLVIAICMAFSAVLAVLVLLNQMTMYINRKAKELSVMRINGYTIKETKTFVSKDNVFLIAIGLIMGCFIGTPMAIFEVCIMETGPSRYIRTPNLSACILSVIICIIFALIVNWIALRKIDKLSLTNVNGN